MADEWKNAIHTVVLRGSTVNDPEDEDATGFMQVELAAMLADAWPEAVAPEMEVDGDNTLVGFLTGLREAVEFECDTIAKSVAIAEQMGVMDGGRIRKALFLLSLPYVWIYRVYHDGGATVLSNLERSDWNRDYDPDLYDVDDPDTYEFYDRYWDTTISGVPGQLPMAVLWDREGRPEYVGDGLYEWRFRLMKLATEEQ